MMEEGEFSVLFHSYRELREAVARPRESVEYR